MLDRARRGLLPERLAPSPIPTAPLSRQQGFVLARDRRAPVFPAYQLRRRRLFEHFSYTELQGPICAVTKGLPCPTLCLSRWSGAETPFSRQSVLGRKRPAICLRPPSAPTGYREVHPPSGTVIAEEPCVPDYW